MHLKPFEEKTDIDLVHFKNGEILFLKMQMKFSGEINTAYFMDRGAWWATAGRVAKGQIHLT